MSIKVMTLVWDVAFPNLPAKMVALKLADCANDAGDSIFPSVRTITKTTGCVQSTVRKWLAAMEHCGLLVVTERSAGGAHGDTTKRRFNMEMLRELAVDEPTKQLVEATVKRISEKTGKPYAVTVFNLVDKSAQGGCGQSDPRETDDGGTPPSDGGVETADPSAARTPPLRVTEATPPCDGANPSLTRQGTFPPTPQGGERVKAIDRLIEEVRGAKPDRDRVIDLLFDPILRQRSLTHAPDKAYSLGVIADWARQYPDDLLIAARDTLLRERATTVKPADIEATVKRLAAVAKTQARADAIRTAPKPAGRRDLVPLAGETQALHAALGRRLPEQAVSEWFSNAFAAERDGSTLRVAFPVPFAKRWVDGHFAEILQAAAAESVPGIAQVETIVGTAAQQPAIGEMRP